MCFKSSVAKVAEGYTLLFKNNAIHAMCFKNSVAKVQEMKHVQEIGLE
jgi:hypothetical protein